MHDIGHAGALGQLFEFRERLYRCLTSRADALFDLADAVLCAGGPVISLAGLPLPRVTDGRIALAVDVSHWPRPDAACSPERLF